MNKHPLVLVDQGIRTKLPLLRVQVVGQLSSGGMGAILKAQDKMLLRTVVVKTTLDDSESQEMRLLEEAQIMAQLEHPGIPPVYEIGNQTEGKLAFAQKWIRGKTLADVCCAHPPATRSPQKLWELLQIFVKVCDTVSFAHSRGVLHRDLKPDNIMVGEFGEVYVIDWGLARLPHLSQPTPLAKTIPPTGGFKPVREYHTSTDTIIGTLSFMSPEQANGACNATDSSDQFSLGAILYWIITGEPPYDFKPEMSQIAKVLRVQQCEIESPEQRVNFEISPSLAQIAMKAMNKSPSGRYPSVMSLRDAMEGFLRSQWSGSFPRVEFNTGDLIVREGEAGDCMFILLSGTCLAWRMLEGEKVPLRNLKTGDIIGELALLTDGTRSANVEAVEPVTAVKVHRELLSVSMEADSVFASIVRALAERFRALDQEAFNVRERLGVARLEQLAFRFLLDTSESRTEGSFSVFCKLANQEFQITPEQVQQILLSQKNWEIDLSSDLLRFHRSRE